MKKTILYIITQSELGGAQKYVFDLAKNLQNEFNISVAVGEQGEKGELINKLKQENIKYHIIPHLKRTISPIDDFLALIEIIIGFLLLSAIDSEPVIGKSTLMPWVTSGAVTIKIINNTNITSIYGTTLICAIGVFLTRLRIIFCPSLML